MFSDVFINLFYIIPKKILSPTFIKNPPKYHSTDKIVGDNIFINHLMKGGFILDSKYEEGIKCLKKCWKERGHIITAEEKVAMKSFRGFFLSGKSEPYSHKIALKWLSDNQLVWGLEFVAISIL